MDDIEIENSCYQHSRTIIHLDIDCFYAQCEMLKNPQLVNKPLGINQKNYIITSNYIARRFGIRKCMLVTEALSLCPELVIVNGEDLYDYRKMSASFTEVVKGFSNKVERSGLDENIVDISELITSRLQEKNHSTPDEFVGHVFKNILKSNCTCGCNERLKLGSAIAKEIRDKIKDVLKLTCSAGIGHNKLLAKLMSKEHKPDQQTTILPSGVFTLMSGLSFQDIPGIGRKTSDILYNLNIKSVVDIQNCSLQKLEKHLGKSSSEWIFKSSFGIDDSEVKISGKPLTLSIEDADRKIVSITGVKSKFSSLIERLLILIKEDGRLPTTIKITVRVAGSQKREVKQSSVNPNIVNCENASIQILEIAMKMFRVIINDTKPFHLTLIGIGFSKFKDVLTGKKSIDSFLRKSSSFTSLSTKDSKEINVTDVESKCEVDTFCKYREEAFNSNSFLPNHCPNIAVITESNKINTSPEIFSLDENIITVLQNQYDTYKSCTDDLKITNEAKNKELPQCFTSSYSHSQCLESSKALNCPDGFDEDVFSQLPFDIQQELVNNHTSQIQRDADHNLHQPRTTNTVIKLNNKSKSLKKSKRSLSQMNNIHNYFFKS